MSTYYLFVGNPGTGKSTIINGVAGRALAKTGISDTGAGITYALDKYDFPDVGTFLDTPGLADDEIAKQAAVAIQQALKQDGNYRVVFVLTTEAGRVRPEDKATIECVLKAAPTLTSYGIIINKIGKKAMQKIEANRDVWMAGLVSGLSRPTQYIHYMEHMMALNDEEDVTYTAPEDVINFIKGLPAVYVKSSDVGEVKADVMKELIAQQRDIMELMKKDKEFMQEQLRKTQEALGEAARAALAAQDDARDAKQRAAAAEERAGGGKCTMM